MILNTEDLRIFFDRNTDMAAIYCQGQILATFNRDDALEMLADRLGVEVEDDNSFLLGNGFDSDLYACAADTLGEIETWKAEVGNRLKRADELDRQGRELLSEAARLRRSS